MLRLCCELVLNLHSWALLCPQASAKTPASQLVHINLPTLQYLTRVFAVMASDRFCLEHGVQFAELVCSPECQGLLFKADNGSHCQALLSDRGDIIIIWINGLVTHGWIWLILFHHQITNPPRWSFVFNLKLYSQLSGLWGRSFTHTPCFTDGKICKVISPIKQSHCVICFKDGPCANVIFHLKNQPCTILQEDIFFYTMHQTTVTITESVKH